MAKLRNRRISQGHYTVSSPIRNGGYVVDVTYFEHLSGWIAAAAWDRYLLTDPVPTKRDAVRNARRMIFDKLDADAKVMMAKARETIDRINAVVASKVA